METYIHNVTLNSDDEFAKRFNYVSWLWQRSCDPMLSVERQDFYTNEHFTAKLALEQGYPISFLTEYNSLDK